MKKNIVLVSQLLVLLLVSCKKKHDEHVHIANENELVRLFISDREKLDLYFYNPHKDELGTHYHPVSGIASRIYTTSSGRYVCIINLEKNDVRFFDSGFEPHGDHAHKVGTPKFGRVVGSTGLKPTHFKAHKNHIIVFNDDDGTISYFEEDKIHTSTSPKIINTGQVKHHGALDLFDDGKIAVTVKTTQNPVPGTLPEYVRIINNNGVVVYDTVIRTGGIHGSASNGNMVLFGCVEGVLRVNANGNQEIISKPTYFGSRWMGTILYGKESSKFYGIARQFGVFEINPISKTITPVDTASTFRMAIFDEEGHYIYSLHNNGNNGIIRKINGKTGSVLAEKTINVGFPATGSAGMPQMVATKKFVYIADGINGVLLMLDSDLNLVRTKTLPGKPNSMAFLGFDGEEHTD